MADESAPAASPVNATPETAAPGTVKEMVAEMVDRQSEPSPAAGKILAENQLSLEKEFKEQSATSPSPETPQAPSPAVTTPAGFDPSLHETLDGKPVINADGTLRRIRGRKPARGPGGKFLSSKSDHKKPIRLDDVQPAVKQTTDASTASSGTDSAASVVSNPPSPSTPPVSLEACATAARTVVMTLVSVGHAIGGDEWNPRKQGPDSPIDEYDAMVEVWTDYFQSIGTTEFPPWLGVLLITGSYAGKRLSMPNTKSRLASAVQFVREKLFGLARKA